MPETVTEGLGTLVGFVIGGIIGGVALAWSMRLWYLRRKDVDDLEVAELQAALRAVLDIYRQGLRAKTPRHTKDEKRSVKKKAKGFKKTHDRLRWEDSGHAEEKLSEWRSKVSVTADTPGGQFAPLVAYACVDIPDAIRDAVLRDFARAKRTNFCRLLRDSLVLSRIITAKFLTESQEVAYPWRDPIARATLTDEDVSSIITRILELDRRMDELPEEIRQVARECREKVERDPAQLAAIIDQLPAMLARASRRRDLLKGYPELQTAWVGRVDELASIAAAWRGGEKRIYSVVGFGGQGKSALARRFTETLRRLDAPDDRPLVVWWSFYLHRSGDEFFDRTAVLFDIPLVDKETERRRNSEQIAGDIIKRIATGVDGRRVLLVLDGLEVLQETTKGRAGRIKDVALYGLLEGIYDGNEPDTSASGMVLITTREPLTDLAPDMDRPFTTVDLDQLSVADGADLLINRYGLNIDHAEAQEFVNEIAGHALTLTLTGSLLRDSGATSATLQELRHFIVGEKAKVTDRDVTTRTKPGDRPHRLPGYVLRHCADALDDDHRQIMRLLSCCVRPATERDIAEVFLRPIGDSDEEKSVNDRLLRRKYTQLRNGPIRHLCELRLIEGDEDVGYDMHPLIRRHFYGEEEREGEGLTDTQRKAVHARFFEVLPKRQPKHYPDTMTEMEPLIDAVLHGCRADLAQRAHSEMYRTRIDRMDAGRTTGYLEADLGASETNLQLLRAFFPEADFNADPQVSRETSKAYLIGAAGLALKNTGRPADAIPLFERSAEMYRRQSDLARRSVPLQNLSELFGFLGRLPDAFETARTALTDLEKVPPSDPYKTDSTIFNHADAAEAAARRGEDAAAEHFGKAIDLVNEDWLWGIPGAFHSTWLARSGDFDRARTTGEKNAAGYAEHAGLHEETFMFATQALIERLAWAAQDSGPEALDEMQAFADKALKVGKRSGHHYFYTCALLEAGRCAAARAGYEGDRYDEHVARAKRHLADAESRADYAGYLLIHADIHVTRAQLAKLAGDMPAMHEQCEKAIAICNDPTCDYAWAKQDAERLMANSEDRRRKTEDRIGDTE